MVVDRNDVVLAEDDDDDYLLTKKAFSGSKFHNRMLRVKDGVELMDYLHDQDEDSLPKLILLDLNMPRKDGREVIQEIKNNEKLKQIPIVVFTTSNSDRDIESSYYSGANSFVTKPVDIDDFFRYIELILEYWLSVVQLPNPKGA